MAVVIIKTPEVEEKFRKAVLGAISDESIKQIAKLIQTRYMDKG